MPFTRGRGSTTTNWISNNGGQTYFFSNKSSSTNWKSRKSSKNSWAAVSRRHDHPTFGIRFFPSLSRLEQNLTINSIAVAPEFSFIGHDAFLTWSPRAGSGDLSRSGSGASVTVYAGVPTMGDRDESIGFNGGVYFTAANQIGAIGTTDDIFIGLVFEAMITSGVNGICGKWANNNGWYIAVDSTNARLQFTLQNSSVGAISITSANSSLEDRTWYYAGIFMNRSENSTNGSRIYLNSVASGSGVNFSTLNSQVVDDASSLFVIGTRADSPGTNNYGRRVASISMWKSSAWFQEGAAGPTEWTTVSASRFYSVSGISAQIASGIATPKVITRTTPSYTDKLKDGKRRLFRLSVGWPRVARRRERIGSDILTGYLTEKTATNLFTKSIDISHANWTKPNSTAISGGVDSPQRYVSLQGIVGQVASSQYGVTQAPTLSASTAYVVQCWVKSGAQRWCYLENSTIANGRIWFDLLNQSVGTVQSGIADKWIEHWGNGICRIAARFTGTAAAHTVGVFAASADNTANYSGDGSTIDLYAGLMDLKADVVPTSFVFTDTATASRTIDFLSYNGGANVADSHITMNQRFMTSVLFGSDFLNIPSFSMRCTSTPNRFDSLGRNHTRADFYIIKNGSSIRTDLPVVDFMSGNSVVLTWGISDWISRAVIDGSQAFNSVPSEAIPTGVTDIYCGTDSGGSQCLYGIVEQMRIFRYVTFKPSGIGSATLSPGAAMASYAGMYISASAATTLNPGTPVKAAGTTVASGLSDFSMPSDNRLTYTSVNTKRFQISIGASITTTAVAGVSSIFLAKNGTVDNTTRIDHYIVDGTQISEISLTALLGLEQNDYIELFVDGDAAGDLTVDYMFATVHEV